MEKFVRSELTIKTVVHDLNSFPEKDLEKALNLEKYACDKQCNAKCCRLKGLYFVKNEDRHYCYLHYLLNKRENENKTA